MALFTSGNFASIAATGTDWRDTSRNILEKLDSIRTENDRFNFGFLYITDYLADDAASILNLFRSVTNIDNWIGSVGMGVIGCGQAYMDQPAISVLAGHFPDDSFCIFPKTGKDGQNHDYSDDKSKHPDQIKWEDNALSQEPVKSWLEKKQPMLICIHADPMSARDPSIAMADLEMATSGFIVGGLVSSRSHHYHFANGVCSNELSGAFFSNEIPVATSLSQGCEPISSPHTVTKANENTIYELDNLRAINILQDDLRKKAAASIEEFKKDLTKEMILDLQTIESSDDIPEEFKDLFHGEIHAALPIPQSDQKDYLVRNIMGINPEEGSITISQTISAGEHLFFVKRDEKSVFKDLSKTMLALRDRVQKEQGSFSPKAGLYFSCLARGFSKNSNKANQEMQIIREIIGDIPLTGFYAGGEISNARLYGYTGILVLFL